MVYSACVPAIFSGTPVHQALPLVRAAGLSHYEFWSWWDQDVEKIVVAQTSLGLKPAALCTRNFILNDSARREEYLDGLRQTIDVCRRLGCSTIITQVGQEIPGISRQVQHEHIVEGLKACVPMLEEARMTLVFEPLHTRVDHVGYYLWSCEEAFQIQREVGSEYVKVLVDLYHQYVMDDLDLPRILANLDKIGHFHVAGFPGRHEPHHDSEIDYETILAAIRRAGYSGAVGLEYFPVRPASEGLRKLVENWRNV